MEALHEHLEALVEEYSPEGANGWEVEYSVSHCRKVLMHALSLFVSSRIRIGYLQRYGKF